MLKAGGHVAAELLERDGLLATLDELLQRVSTGSGEVALISGDAGIGKTALVERFVERHAGMVRHLWGACEALFTPRPLGPLYDIARQAPSLRAALEREVPRAELFAAVLDELARGPLPTLVVIEDVHWADEATLDLIKYLARRVHRMPVGLVLTYRDDELLRDHPLRLVLGDLPVREVTRLVLPPLSEAAVATLAAEAHRSPGQVFSLTGGNPFFVSAVLAADTDGALTNVADAVLARVARLAQEAQRLLELVAVAPGGIEVRVVAYKYPEYDSALEACLDARLLALENGKVSFRHELARQAVEGALPRSRRRTLNAQLLHALLEREEQASLAQLVHHAAQAEDGTLVLRYAPAAARQASARGAHRQAAAHYQSALRFADVPDDERQRELRANLLDSLSHEYTASDQMEAAVRARLEALAIWRELDQPVKVGHALCRLSRLASFRGHRVDAERYAIEAITLLESLPPCSELALAYAMLSGLCMTACDNAAMLVWGQRAIEVSEQCHDSETACLVRGAIWSGEMCRGVAGAQAELERSLHMAIERGYEEQVARNYSNLADNLVREGAFQEAATYLREGLAYCAEHGLDNWGQAMQATLAQSRLDQGDWMGADEEATAVLSVPGANACNRIPALVVLGLVRARRGDPGAQAALDEARDLARAAGEMQYITPTAAARAEWRWLRGEFDLCRAEAEEGLDLALAVERPWYWKPAVWLWRSGGTSTASAPQPFASEIAGDYIAAAADWERLGCPYEQALVLAGGDEPAQRAALEIFERLSAAPAAEIVRRRLRAAGARGLPRGPRAATQENPMGLTPRQLEVLLLLAEGLRYSEIADRLATTPKTIEHHVSAVLAKLGVRSRAEAVRAAFHLGLVPQPAGVPVSSESGVR
jgi:DNA-binding CsgD family transcriptional regulator